MLKPEYTKQFKRDYKTIKKRGKNLTKLKDVINLLCNESPLLEKYRDHALVNSRGYKGVRECHIEPDWLLIYMVENDAKVLKLVRTGTHSDLF